MIIFDFDGVLINSMNEVAVTSYNTVTDNLCERLEEVPEAYITLFRNNRPLALRAGDLVVLGKLIVERYLDSPNAFIPPAEYEQFSRTQSPLTLEESFFSTRKKLTEKNENAWLALNTTYQPLWGALQKKDPERVVILTYKNREAVLKLCHFHNLPVLSENIYSGDGGATKRGNFSKIEERFQRPKYFFIDDAFHNLQALRQALGEKSNLTLLLAAWGYTSPEQLELAKEEGLEVFSQEEFIPFLSANF